MDPSFLFHLAEKVGDVRGMTEIVQKLDLVIHPALERLTNTSGETLAEVLTGHRNHSVVDSIVYRADFFLPSMMPWNTSHEA